MLSRTHMRKQHVRLTNDVIPKKYELHLTPDLEAFVFEGKEAIHLELKKPANSITLHSIELDIESVEIVAGGVTQAARKISYNEKTETASISFKQKVPKGNAKLMLVFRGILNDRMHGFYRSSFELNGEKKNLATTQFESTDARRAFPCFAEPAKKGAFET